ncbi:hypothetical protein SB769_14705 [Burkholderia sp. SIMBA_024]
MPASIFLGFCCLAINVDVVKGATDAAVQASRNCDTPTTPFCDALMEPIAGWTGHVFKLAQQYPSTVPNDAQPWLAFDPTREPESYLKAALTYFYEGNIRSNVEESFDPSLNKVRQWYNAPWQDYGVNGREFIHGLTRELESRPGTLDPHQTKSWSTYAVGFYNAPGGMTIGKVWANHGLFNEGYAMFPEGTVSAKLLFTTAPVEQVPYLAGAPEWNAYVYVEDPTISLRREVKKVRLLQIDIAVKDKRAKDTGWVFGTYVYGGGPGSNRRGAGWYNVSAVGVMWGNDLFDPATNQQSQTWLNGNVHMTHYGHQGRLDGPLDDPQSSCMSCHSTAEWPPAQHMTPPIGSSPDETAKWFRNIRSDTPFDQGHTSLDYSLQLNVGMQNFLLAHPNLFKTVPLDTIKRYQAHPISRSGND